MSSNVIRVRSQEFPHWEQFKFCPRILHHWRIFFKVWINEEYWNLESFSTVQIVWVWRLTFHSYCSILLYSPESSIQGSPIPTVSALASPACGWLCQVHSFYSYCDCRFQILFYSICAIVLRIQVNILLTQAYIIHLSFYLECATMCCLISQYDKRITCCQRHFSHDSKDISGWVQVDLSAD